MDIKNIEKQFDIYVSNYDFNNENIKRKYYHSYRVAKICEEIAKELNLEKSEIEVAKIIGLLHDIGRFEEYTNYKEDNIDHAELGADIILKNNFLNELKDKEEYGNIIIEAIKNHNKFVIDDSIENKCLLFTRIIRDADKLDIFYEAVEIFYNTEEKKKEIEKDTISDSIIECMKEQKTIKTRENMSKIERLIIIIAFIFDFNFDISLKILAENNYINNIIKQFKFKNKDTVIKMEEIRKIANEYIENKLKNKGDKK